MQVLDNGGVEFSNEGSGARLRVFAALKHPFMKQAGPHSCTQLLKSWSQAHSITPWGLLDGVLLLMSSPLHSTVRHALLQAQPGRSCTMHVSSL